MVTLYIDADTILYSSACKEEINKCVATNTTNGKKRTFESKTAFNNWHAEKSQYPKEAYTFEVEKELVGEASYACASVRNKIEHILENVEHDDFRVCIQGKGNYRNAYVSKYVDYKGQRGAKPLLYNDVFEYTKRKWGDRVIVSDMQETDDVLSLLAWKHWSEDVSLVGHDIIIAYCDKDIQQNCPGILVNYNKIDEGPFLNTREMQYKGFWKSCLTGDAADNIDGVLKLSQETKQRYGIKTDGCGPVAATRILCTTESEKECAERVLETYKLSWPDDYMERMQDMCFFLWLRREEGEMFDLKKYLERLGVEHAKRRI